MKFKYLIFILCLVVLVLEQCAVGPPPPPLSRVGPTVRIGIAEQLASITFETNYMINIRDQNDRLIGDKILGGRWQVKVINSTPAPVKYKLLYKELNNQLAADRVASNLENRGIPVTIKKIKKTIFFQGKLTPTIVYQILLKPVFNTEDEAKDYRRSPGDQIYASILPFFTRRPGGTLILKNLDTGEEYQSPGLIQVEGDLFILKVRAGKGFHFEREEQRSYRHRLEFWIDRYGKITVVNQIPLEDYLKGVVGSEMHPKFPLEALKAQAVTARCYSLARLSKQHRLEPFDLCDEVHCHVYGGVANETKKVSQAVVETQGLVLMYQDKICDTYYAGVCGGHTENNENVWYGKPLPYLRGVLDSNLGNLLPDYFLKSEHRVRQWIESSPEVFCNTMRNDVPDYLDYTKKYFRWEVRYSREEISKIILDKTGENIGLLIDIVSEERGVSGRLKKITLRGSITSLTIEKELEIRKALSRNYLYSSCFVVDRVGNDFILKGAGWGHGVGMCQTGAAMMALQGINFRDILKHYYKNSKLAKLY